MGSAERLLRFAWFLLHLPAEFVVYSVRTRQPRMAWRHCRIRILKRTGIDLTRPYVLDRHRRLVAGLEAKHTRAPTPLTQFGNYMLQADAIPTEPVICSAGVGGDVRFEEALLDAYPQAELYLVDPTPRSRSFIEGHPLRGRVTFLPIALAGQDEELELYSDERVPKDFGRAFSLSIHARGLDKEHTLTVPAMRLETLMENVGVDHIDVLKMDIEGSVPSVLLDMLASAVFPDQIACEIEVPPASVMPVEGFVEETDGLLDRLRRAGYVLHDIRTESYKRGRSLEVLAVRDGRD